MSYPADSAAAKGLALCHICHHLDQISLHECQRCGSPLHLRKTNSLQRSLALLFTAIICYIPANVLPIMNTVQLNKAEPATIIGGVVILMKMGSYPIAGVIFFASVMVPIAKMIAIAYLIYSAHLRVQVSPEQRTVLYRITEFVGRWSMIDVFVVAILVALVRLQGIITIQPGIAALAFAGVVVLTMLSAQAFDIRLIW
ncbi:MAG: paraquat-inducible protein A, partial [Gammaproteobacteria bacterium]